MNAKEWPTDRTDKPWDTVKQIKNKNKDNIIPANLSGIERCVKELPNSGIR